MWQRKCTPAKIIPKIKGGENPTIPAARVVYLAEKVHCCKNTPKTQARKQPITPAARVVYQAEKMHSGKNDPKTQGEKTQLFQQQGFSMW